MSNPENEANGCSSKRTSIAFLSGGADVSADMLIRLASVTTTYCGRRFSAEAVCAPAGRDVGLGWWPSSRLHQQHQGPEKSRSAPETTIESKRVLVEVGLEVLRLDSSAVGSS